MEKLTAKAAELLPGVELDTIKKFISAYEDRKHELRKSHSSTRRELQRIITMLLAKCTEHTQKCLTSTSHAPELA